MAVRRAKVGCACHLEGKGSYAHALVNILGPYQRRQVDSKTAMGLGKLGKLGSYWQEDVDVTQHVPGAGYPDITLRQ